MPPRLTAMERPYAIQTNMTESLALFSLVQHLQGDGKDRLWKLNALKISETYLILKSIFPGDFGMNRWPWISIGLQHPDICKYMIDSKFTQLAYKRLDACTVNILWPDGYGNNSFIQFNIQIFAANVERDESNLYAIQRPLPRLICRNSMNVALGI